MENSIEEKLTEEEFPPMQFTEEMQYYIFEAARWSKMLSVFGFVVSGMLVVMSLTIASIFPMLVKISPSMGSVPGGAQAISIFYFVIAAISFTFSLYLFQFAKGAKEGISYNSEKQVTAAFTKLKSFFKLWGILALIITGFYVISLFGGIAGKV